MADNLPTLQELAALQEVWSQIENTADEIRSYAARLCDHWDKLEREWQRRLKQA